MRTIERASRFKRDYKREARGKYQRVLDAELKAVLIALANDQSLEPRYRDHNLSGGWSGYRECHIKPDLLLIYRTAGTNTLRLARLGSHSQLFK